MRATDKRRILLGQGPDQARLDLRIGPEEIERVHGRQADVDVGVAVELIDERLDGLVAGLVESGGPADPFEPLRGRGPIEHGEGDSLAHVLELVVEGRYLAGAAAARQEGAGPDPDDEEGEAEGEAISGLPERPELLPEGDEPVRGLPLGVLEHGVEVRPQPARRLLLGKDAELGPDGAQAFELLPAGGAGGDMRPDLGLGGRLDVPDEVIGELFLGFFTVHEVLPSWRSR